MSAPETTHLPAPGFDSSESKMNDLIRLSAGELASRIAQGELSCREAVEAHLERIGEIDDHVNAIPVVLAEQALAAADDGDRARRRGEPLGPLHGVPFTVKENLDCTGSATTHGVPAFEHALPPVDAPVVERARRAGAIPIGRTNLSEWGLRLSTDNPLRGRTLNPWNPHLTAGGSSGGDAVALATGMTPLGLANDIGGSLRSPAYCTGVAALKPTTGRIARGSSLEPADGGFALQQMLVDGPMARTVADLRLALGVLAGRDPRDPRSVDAPVRDGVPSKRHAAVVCRVPGVELPPITVAEVNRAGSLLEADGWVVEEAEPPELDLVVETWGELVTEDFSAWLPHVRASMSERLFDHMTRLCRLFENSQRSRVEIHARRSRLARLWSTFFVRYPVLVCPTWTQLPWPIDADLEPGTGLRLLLDTTRLLLPANVLGLPAVALPTGVADGLPTGVQVYADLWREDLCLAAAEIVERGGEPPTPIDPFP